MLIGAKMTGADISHIGVPYILILVPFTAWMNNRSFIDKVEVSRNKYGINAINANYLQIGNFTADNPNIRTLPIT